MNINKLLVALGMLKALHCIEEDTQKRDIIQTLIELLEDLIKQQ